MPMMASSGQKWGLFTNHALVMAYVCEHADSTVRAISDAVGITERATLAMLGDLQQAGIIVRHRVGRANTYSMDFERLAMFRRGNAGPPTPASFANALIETLLRISGRAAGRAPARPAEASGFSGEGVPWGFFTNHLRTLLAVANAVDPTANDIAGSVGITERAAVAILRQLEDEGMLIRSKEGRRNSYRIEFERVRDFPRWSMGPWPLQQQLIDASVEGLRELAAASAARSPTPIREGVPSGATKGRATQSKVAQGSRR
jgi:DNA-binding MarR family transcriptional regulator